jgi:hypothetical protein
MPRRRVGTTCEGAGVALIELLNYLSYSHWIFSAGIGKFSLASLLKLLDPFSLRVSLTLGGVATLPRAKKEY